MTTHAAEFPTATTQVVIEIALDEDLGPAQALDVTTLSTIPADQTTTAHVVARAPGVVAGVPVIRMVLEAVTARLGSTGVDVQVALDDGTEVSRGDVIATVTGPTRTILIAERTLLNLLSRVSGVATHTRRWMDALRGTGCIVLDTRKTTPGLRALEKAAVRAGGAQNHRGNLSEWVMLKDNHLTLVSIADAVVRARRLWPGRLVHVECDRFDQVVAALDADADAVLLDNMDPAEVRRCVDEVDRRVPRGGRGRPLIEISGGIDATTLASYAGCGADRVSVGAITNSAAVLDIGLDIDADPDPGAI